MRKKVFNSSSTGAEKGKKAYLDLQGSIYAQTGVFNYSG